MSNEKMSLSERYKRMFGIQPHPESPSHSGKTMGERFMEVNEQQTHQYNLRSYQQTDQSDTKKKHPRKGAIPRENIDNLVAVYAYISQFNNLENLSTFLELCQITPSGVTAHSKSSDGKTKTHKVTERTIKSLFSLFGIPYHEAAAAQLLKNMRAVLDQVSLRKFNSIMKQMKLSENLIIFLSASFAFYDKYLLYIDEHSKKYQAIFQLNESLRSKTELEPSKIRNLIKALYYRFAEAERLTPAPGHYELEQLHSNPNYKAVFCLEHQNYALEVEAHEEESPETDSEEIVDTNKNQSESITERSAKEIAEPRTKQADNIQIESDTDGSAEEITEPQAAETAELQIEVFPEDSTKESAEQQAEAAGESSSEEKSKKRKTSYSIALRKLPPLPHHSIKNLALENYKRQVGKNSEIALFLEAIAGSVEAADRLAMLFADIAVPGSSNHNMSVIHTSSDDSLILKLLKSVFSIAPDEEPISINQLFSSDGKRSLLDKHIKGVPLILVKDILPNYNNISDFAKLMSGKKISVNIAPYPNQYFYSHFHLVCITSKQKVVDKFAELGANVVTLEPKLLASEFRYNLLHTDIIWLRTAFLLHGCRLRYVERKSNRHKPQTIAHSSRIFEFFTGQCEIAEGQKIERSEIYNAYCDYHKTEYGCEPTESNVIFIKEMKKLLPSDEMYKVSRYGEDKKTHMCFIGLRLKQVPSTEKIHTSEFGDYLKQIEQYADSLVSKVKDPKKIFRVVAK